MTIQKLINIETNQEVARYDDATEPKPKFGGVQAKVEGTVGLEDEPLFRWEPVPQAELDADEAERIRQEEVATALQFLIDTDYMFLMDTYQTFSNIELDLASAKRAEARLVIKVNES